MLGSLPQVRTAYDDVTLTGDGFTLRAPTLEDVDDIAAACVDEETQRWLPLPHPYTADHARHFVGQTAPQQLDKTTKPPPKSPAPLSLSIEPQQHQNAASSPDLHLQSKIPQKPSPLCVPT